MQGQGSKTLRLAVPALALLLLLSDLLFNILAPLEHVIDDVLLRLHAQTRMPADNIVLVDIDQKSLEELNETAGSWPWPRSLHGEMIDGIAAQKPVAIIFDMMFNEADTFRPESDGYLREAVGRHPQVYLPTLLLNDGQGAPLKEVARIAPGLKLTGTDASSAPLLLPLITDPSSWRGGLINFLDDADGVGRHYLSYQRRGDWKIPSLPMRLAEDNGWSFPPDEQFMLNWYGISPTRVSYTDIYADLQREQRQRPANEFANKIVIIGTTAPGLQDLRVTPLSNVYPGAQILSTALSNLQNDDWLREHHLRKPLLTLLMLALVAASLRRWPLQKTGIGLIAITLLGVLSVVLLMKQQHFVYGLSALAAAWLVYAASAGAAYLEARAERERAVAMFSRFLDPRVVQQLVGDSSTSLSTTAQARQVTVLFSDIRGFTTLSETRAPEEIVSLLNRYFSRQVEVIFRHGGTLDKFIGDAIMAFWGAPVDDADHAEHATAAALEMVEVLLDFRKELGELGEVFDVGIGIHTGPAVVGFIGSSERLDYTAIGDSVNLASRIEGQTKGIARILVSGSTHAACSDKFDFVDHGSFHVKGREAEVTLYEPVNKQPSIDRG